jgi:transaldolase/glucose-6-phosphate isomerase
MIKTSRPYMGVGTNPLEQLEQYGQSIWLDFLRRGMLASGEIQQLIDEDGLKGMTSNPSIFEKAIAGSHDYDGAIEALALEGRTAKEIYQSLVVEDVQRAADTFRPIYDETGGGDGYVSLEVSPHLARDTEGTIAEARRLWAAVDRPNVMIKVPATPEGLPAIRQLIAAGVNVNVTLLFGLARYRQVAEVYLTGLQDRLNRGKPIDRIASVASFFLSRIDVLVDPMLEKRMRSNGPLAKLAEGFHGQVAISSARMAYEIYQDILRGRPFAPLAEQGARVQRLLWASTSTKNPAYSDVKYVEALIGPETVNTVPLETLDAYRDHGNPALRLETGTDRANEVLSQLPELGINMEEVTRQLEDEGIDKFVKPYDKLLDTLEKERHASLQKEPDRKEMALGNYGAGVREHLAELEAESFSARLWRKDARLWKDDPEQQEPIHDMLGWLHVAEKMEGNLGELSSFAAGVRPAGFRHVVHIGMGGSSLAPLAFERTFKPGDAGLPLTVLDTTDPATILQVEKDMPLTKTLFIVASKSGTTAETRALADYFYERVAETNDKAGAQFVAITDPGSPLVDLARDRSFRRVFLNYPDIGGRYSALSYFGLVPAALLGIDVAELLARALRMRHACASSVPAEQNPGLMLGAALGELALQGRNKVTFVVPERIATLGMWLEQLLAESTGKEGTGLLPIAGERLGDPDAYGQDRVFVVFQLAGREDLAQQENVSALRQAGHPVITLWLDDRLDLGQEFYRWEMATATAGAILGINAFNQPNVQESKDNTNRLLQRIEREGRLPEEGADVTDGPLSFYTEEPRSTAAETLAAFLEQAQPGDYVALMAYLTEKPGVEQALQRIRLDLRDRMRLATTVGYGPRFLHSTGQFHKGGPNTGHFLQLTVDDKDEVPVPHRPYSFATLKKAQALGDLEALRKHERRVMRIHLGQDAEEGLAFLHRALETADIGKQ